MGDHCENKKGKSMLFGVKECIILKSGTGPPNISVKYQLNFLDPYAYIKLEGKEEQCAPGMDIASEAECRDANQQIIIREILSGIITQENRRTPEREGLLTGSWNHVPSGCSYQAIGDGALHFNRKPVSDAVNFVDGTFKMVCRQGIKL